MEVHILYWSTSDHPIFCFFKGGGVNISKKSLLYISLVFSMVIIFSANVGFATDNLTDNTTNSLSETDILSRTKLVLQKNQHFQTTLINQALQMRD